MKSTQVMLESLLADVLRQWQNLIFLDVSTVQDKGCPSGDGGRKIRGLRDP